MTTTAPVALPTGTWNLDPVHSSIGFDVKYLVGTFHGQFRDVDGALEIRENGARLAGRAQVSSVDVKDENLAAHLQSPDFFDAERHPDLRFESDEIEVDADAVTVRGEITIKGVTQPIVLTGTATEASIDPFGAERIGLHVAAAVDRTDFGVSWNAPLPTGKPALDNRVELTGELYFVKAVQPR
jgi:polyisoprenoid-binding protein YceI